MKNFSDIEIFECEVLDIAHRLREMQPTVSIKDCIDFAIRIQYNQLYWEQTKRYELAHCLQELTPSALEAIAIQLGYKGTQMTSGDLLSSLDQISQSIEDKK